jgi:serine phosphatase RsbU (regulator of sigma subunit)
MDMMKRKLPETVQWVIFTVIILTTVMLYGFYLANMVRWKDNVDFGWRTMYESGPNVVAEVFKGGEQAGLRAGDTIVAINGQSYSTFDELFFVVRNHKVGSSNNYSIVRNEVSLEVNVVNSVLGISSVVKRSGPLFAIGLIYVFIGILVFLMKPMVEEFLLMTISLGVSMSYSSPADIMRPFWLFDVRQFIDVFIPAPLIHLALIFPRQRKFLERWPWLRIAPYCVSLVLYVLYESLSTAYWDSPPLLDLVNGLYLLAAVIFFIGTTLWNITKDDSHVIKLQSQAIFIGILLGFLIPSTELMLRFTLDLYLFPDPALGFAVFFAVFPVAIGYTIVKHDLFAIDVVVRRTYGYILSTAAIVGVYGLIVSGLNLTLQFRDVSRSPAFSLLFALAVVFTFRPLHGRIQSFVDRVFYRQKYDYRKTIREMSQSLLRIFDAYQIRRTLIVSVVGEMYLENGLMMIREKAEKEYKPTTFEGEEKEKITLTGISEDEAIVEVLKTRGTPIFRHEIELNPAYEKDRESLQTTFQSLDSELMLPLTYKDEFRGIVSFGRKKSGKMFTPEDVDLLETVTNQTAVALENAHLFEENLEKGRMEEELRIAHDLQSSMLPESPPEKEGFQIAARSISAREVGGDFYDFLEIGGEGRSRKLGIVVGDVSGKAVSGALVMAAARSVFRVLSDNHSSVKDIMSISNARLKKDVQKGMYVALLYAVIDSEEKKMTLSNAGQTQPILCPGSGGDPLYLHTEGDRFPLGIVDDCDYREREVSLESGDTVTFYTDGVVEAMNSEGEIYGFDRFREIVNGARGQDAQSLLEILMEDVSGFVQDARQHDDITVVVVRVD